MGAPKGNKNALGNSSGTGRKSLKDERADLNWHADKWELDTDVPVLQEKLATKRYSVRDVFLAKALQGNERILGIFANKLLPDLHQVEGNIQAAIEHSHTTPELERLRDEYETKLRKTIIYDVASNDMAITRIPDSSLTLTNSTEQHENQT